MNIIKAIHIAYKYLDRNDDGLELEIVSLFNFDKGIFITYQTKKFIQENDFDESLIGAAPFIIDKSNGEITICPSRAMDRDDFIKYFKEKFVQ